MILVAASLIFGLLCLVSLGLALRGEEKRAPFWLAAVAAALALGFSLGSVLQDGQLANQVDALIRETERLQRENTALSARLEPTAMPGSELLTSENELPTDALQPKPPGDSVSEPGTPEPAGSEGQAPAFVVEPVAVGALSPTNTGPEETMPLASEDEAAPLERATESPAEQASETAQIAQSASVGATDLATEAISAEEGSAPTEAGQGADETIVEESTDAAPSGEATAVPPSREPLQGEGLERVSEGEPISLTGTWEMRTTIEESSYPAFMGAELTFELELVQDGEQLRALGEKLAEQPPGDARREYPAGSRTPITLAGKFIGERLLQVIFEEEGASRSSEGAMMLTVVSPTRLEGSFSSSAAGSAGRVILEKEDP